MRLAALAVLLTASLHAQSAPAPSAILRPALDLLAHDLDAIHADRWKLNALVRDQSASDLNSLRRDLGTTLPPLLTAADAAPAQLTSQLPVARNIAALYDVLLRLAERARFGAPQDQQGALEQARATLDTARRAFDEQLQTSAAAQEAQVQQLKTRLATPPPVAAPAPPPPARKKKKR